MTVKDHVVLVMLHMSLVGCGGASPPESSSSSGMGVDTETLILQESSDGFCSFSGVIDTKHQDYSGAGFVDTENNVGASIVLAVNALRAGNYGVNVRYANGGDQARGGNLKVDEWDYSVALNLDITSGWEDWQIENGSVSLQEGSNTIRLVAQTSQGLANIDYVSFSGAGLSASECDDVVTDGNNVTPGTPGDIYPLSGAMDVNPDTHFRLAFDDVPSIQNGEIKIVDASNDFEVDRISVNLDSELVGERSLNAFLVSRLGNTVMIKPHSNKLSYGKTYNVLINNGVLNGKIQGKDFTGLSGNEWQFTTKSSGPIGSTVSVDDDGPADFGSIQGAFNYIMSRHGGSTNAQVNIKNGVYPELLHLKDKSNIRVVGESRDKTIIRARNGNTLNAGSSGRPLFLINGGDLIHLENLTIHNSATRGGGDGQAEAIYFNSNDRLIVKNVALFSEQDTVQTKGYSWFYNTLISGNVDFIWGSPRVSLFERSEIRSIGDSQNPSSDTGGYVLQSRTPTDALGFIFLDSSFTRGKGPSGNTPGNGKSALGRGANKDNTYDNAAFINCKMDSHITAEGYDTGRVLNPFRSTVSTGYREYGSTSLSGEPIGLEFRYSMYWLNESEVNDHYSSRRQIFSGYNNGQGWDPLP